MNKNNVEYIMEFIEKAVIFVILVSTITAISFEILNMINKLYVELADLLLLFIYVEVIGMVRVYYISNKVRMTYPLLIGRSALGKNYRINPKRSYLTGKNKAA